jgi:hypothetical protein
LRGWQQKPGGQSAVLKHPMTVAGAGETRTQRSASQAHLYFERSQPLTQPSGHMGGDFVQTT